LPFLFHNDGQTPMSETVVCILSTGDSLYFRSACIAVQSVLRFTDFDVFFAHDRETLPDLENSRRVTQFFLGKGCPGHDRARPFLNKFQALQDCLNHGRHPFLIALDADAVVVRRITSEMLEKELDGRSLAMVEQTGIIGSDMTRRELLDHYVHHTLVWFGNVAAAPPVDTFRFYNSGVVLARREGIQEFLNWAGEWRLQKKGAHRVGCHMIADQDYYQYWVNTLEPGTCTTLTWHWNHCEHWDDPFPREGAMILHFSNFCLKPTRLQIAEMAFFGHRGVKAKDTFARVVSFVRRYVRGGASRFHKIIASFRRIRLTGMEET